MRQAWIQTELRPEVSFKKEKKKLRKLQYLYKLLCLLFFLFVTLEMTLMSLLCGWLMPLQTSLVSHRVSLTGWRLQFLSALFFVLFLKWYEFACGISSFPTIFGANWNSIYTR